MEGISGTAIERSVDAENKGPGMGQPPLSQEKAEFRNKKVKNRPERLGQTPSTMRKSRSAADPRTFKAAR